MRASHGWAEITEERKREIISAIATGGPTRGPVHAELDLTDRCNVACYFCNQIDVRTKEQVPIEKALATIDELAGAGLRSVRLSGGGDPLFHREIVQIIDHLQQRQVVIDNLTTNGVALTEPIAQRLVANRAREVVFSLNAVDAADYHRMLRVKPGLFETVLENVRRLVRLRGASAYPAITVQFLLDRGNFERLADMYELGRSLGPDRIAVNPVLEIPRERIDEKNLLTPEDREAMRPHLEHVLERDKDARLLQIDFPIPGWNEVFAEARAKTGWLAANDLPTAASFREENAGCFFAWYTTTITGNGDVRPCCLLLNPDVKPLGNIHDAPILEHWHGPEYQKLRGEMRDVLLTGGEMEYSESRFEHLKAPCVGANKCWLKNMYFRGDEAFYAELDQTLIAARSKEISWTGNPQQRRRAADIFFFRRLQQIRRGAAVLFQRHPRARQYYQTLRDRSRPLRLFLKRNVRRNPAGSV